MLSRSRLLYIGVFWGCAFLPARLNAIPLNVSLFCSSYPEAPACLSGRVTCQTCHEAPPSLNLYGGDLSQKLRSFPDFDKSPAAFSRYLDSSLKAIEGLDSDRDGRDNLAEITQGSDPAKPQSEEPAPGSQTYDAERAWRRLNLLFCGQAPSYEEVQAFRAQEAPQRMETLHQSLDRCVTSRFWLETALPRLADDKIKPNRAVGVEGNPFVIGDYRYDYRLFVHAMSGDRDMRELLTAQYHIGPQGERIELPIPDQRIEGKITVANGQPLETARRYGMITTQWFISTNTMFAELPRNTASQAYRAYLGLDIARSEGLFPVANEPRDVDQKGVKEEACAFCHSTLDPLAYAFAPYVGLRGARIPVGSYDPNFTQWENWAHLFGEPVADLGSWVEKAVNSQAFRDNLTLLLYRYAVGQEPEGTIEEEEFRQLSQRLPELGFNAQRLLHAIIETQSFGGRP